MRQQEIHYLRLLYIQLTTLFCDWPKAYSEFFESAPEASSSCILYNNHVKVTQGDGQLCHVGLQCMISRGNHVKFVLWVACWFIYFYTFINKIIISSTYCHDHFSFLQCTVKQLLDSVFVIYRIIKVSVTVISLSLGLITPSSTLIVLDITKTSHNNCL